MEFQFVQKTTKEYRLTAFIPLNKPNLLMFCRSVLKRLYMHLL